MGLSGYTPKTEMVEYPGGSFAVRGLSLEDFTVLLRAHHKPMADLFDRYVSEAALESVDANTGGALHLGDMKAVVLEAFELAPALVGDAIARAADETENPHIARLLPIGVQIDAITKIVRLTLEAEGGVEKLAETVSTLAASLSTVAASRSP
ncbi:tail protein [Ruegeria phage vB_RpoS-V18]|uniref:tail protein n=2 Tax=unclassified Casjensviridae TaxID=2960002 RepID=UPI000DCACAD9|nr:tail protein [Ruegeria phage vB_RpoS-V18]YP_009997349.1 tail protein [Ruegeria phage vB_RpoS-V11]AWY08926.1 tail protein [Ruegeria phage vB_RpoS-V18]AWY09090.1 tail protein [Ruegeria phage vB_RpoS-V11]